MSLQPRKCSYTNRVISSKDHASVQINIGKLDANGVYTGEFEPVALVGYIRQKAEGDAAFNRIAAERGLMRSMTSFPDAINYKSEQ